MTKQVENAWEDLVLPQMGKTILALDQASKTSGFAVYIDGKLDSYGKFTYDDIDIDKRLVKIR